MSPFPALNVECPLFLSRWVLDVSFREEENRSRKDHVAENLAWVRRLTVSLFAKDGTKVGVLCKRKMAGWDDEYMLSTAGKAIA